MQGPIKEELASVLGFNYAQFVGIRESIREVYLDNLQMCLSELGEVTEDWEVGGRSNQRPDEIERGRKAATDVFIYPGSRAAFTAEELAERTGTEVSVVATVLDLFSTNFATCDPVDSVRHFLDGEGPFFRASLISDGAGNFVTLSMPIGTDCFRHIVEGALKETPMWARYDRQRTRISETLSVEYLETILQTKATKTGFKYYAPKKNIPVARLTSAATDITSIGKEVEADALFLIEDVAICVEVKGRSISDGAKRGHVGRLSTDLERTIGEATLQAHRLEALIEQNQGLWQADRTWLSLDHVREIRSIAVCLDDMGPLATALDELIRSDIIGMQNSHGSSLCTI